MSYVGVLFVSLKVLPLLQPIYQTFCFSTAPSEAPVSVDGKALSATEATVWWLPLSQTNIDGYQVSRNLY